MAKKVELKVAKFKVGDVLKYTNPLSKKEYTVILTKRYDIKPNQSVAWWYKAYPDGIEEYGAPESEFSIISQ